ncbi:MAG: heavy metal translocating P-type ATPase [Lachnospiraceae bacterium]|nr:heavy metal translocating P-type ATPase [Lachnospiraceae bacterium]
MQNNIYILEGLGCANCAAKMEQKISMLEGVDEVSIVFATRQMRLRAEDPDALMEEITKVVHSLEPDVTIRKRELRRSSREHLHTHGHHHEHEESCGCGHEHHHGHEESCGCGHEHHHEHEESCGCGHEHVQAYQYEHHSGHQKPGKGDVTVYILENLNCANCAAKIEQKLNTLPEIEDAVLTFATKQVKIRAEHSADLMELVQKTVDSIEDGVTVKKKAAGKKAVKATEAAGEKMDPMKAARIQIFTGTGLFVLAEILELLQIDVPHLLINGFLLAAYLILGGEVLLTAFRNIKKGHVFDENFLMGLATLGALATNQVHEAVGVMLFYRIGEYFEQRASNQSRKQIMDAVDMRPEVVNLVSGDAIEVIDAEAANTGDILLVRPGDRIPLDSVVIEGESRIDTSPVTGEPVPVKAGVGDSVTSGCVNLSGVLKIRVEKVLEESLVSRILDSVENAAANKPQIDKFITRFSRVYTPVVVLLALAVALLPNLLDAGLGLIDFSQFSSKMEDPLYWVTTALTFLVISCPCALVLSVPLAFFSGIGSGSKKGILFKGGITLESLTKVKAVVMDKTGTITEGNFVVQKAVPFAGSGLRVQQLLSLAASCELSSTHPIGTSITAAAREAGVELKAPSRMQEFAGKGVQAVLDADTVLCGNRKLMHEFGIDLDGYHEEGFGTEVLVAVNGRFAGNLLISDTIKKEAPSAIAKTKAFGIVTAMLTGDAKDSADAVAAETGIDEVYAKLLPQDKLEHLEKIRSKHGSVMFVGDGINDAPVLAGADVGAAMGSGADAAIEAADVVFMTSSMDAIPQAIDIAKATNRISWQNVYFALGIKIFVMLLGLLGHASMWLAVFADTGVAMLCLLNSMRILYRK